MGTKWRLRSELTVQPFAKSRMSDVKSKDSHTGSHSFAFTFNFPGPASAETILKQLEDSGLYKRGIFQKEIGEEGREHYQGWVYTVKTTRVKAVKDHLQTIWPGGHVEPTYKPPVANWRYCSKEDTRVEGPWSFGGAPAGAGKRTDLGTVAREFASSNFSMDWLRLEHPGMFIRYRKGFEELREASITNETRIFPEVRVYYGVPGSGKSHRADTEYPRAHRWAQSTNGNVYAGNYRSGNPHHIFEDFSGWVPFRWLMAFLDKYPIQVNAMGRMVDCQRRVVIFTSNTHPRDWYSKLEEEKPGTVWPALKRRITSITHYPWPYQVDSPSITESTCAQHTLEPGEAREPWADWILK